MAKKDDIALWSDLFKNPNYKPTIIGGVSRGGTTWVYRNLLQYKTTLETVALEEYFHQFYKFTFGDRIQIDRDTMNKALAEKRVINDPLDLNWRTEIGVRYKELRKRYSWNQVFIKVLPFHLENLRNNNEDAFIDICKNNYWLCVIRRDWVRMVMSNIYSNAYNKFHYYKEDELLRDKKIKANMHDVTTYLQQYIKLYNYINSTYIKDFKLIYCEDIQHLQHTDTAKTSVKGVKGIHNLPVPPVIKEGKDELYKELIINYDDVVDFGASIIQAFGERTDGKIKLNANEIEMDLS